MRVAVYPHEAAQQHHAVPREQVQVEGVPAVLAGELRVGREPGAGRGELVSGLLEPSHGDAPEQGVFASIPARSPYGAAHAQVHATPALIQFLDDLAAGIGAADHQHCPGWQRTGVAVVTGVELEDLGGQGASEG